MSKQAVTTSQSSTALLDGPGKSSRRSRMELVFDRKELTRELAHLEHFANAGTMPILQHLLVSASADEQTATFTSTNLETALVSVVPAQVSADAAFTAPAKEIHKVIRSLPGDNVRITTGRKSRVKIAGDGNLEFELSSLPPEEFPEIPKAPDDNAILIPADLLNYAIKKVTFAVADTEYALAMKCALLKIDGNRLIVVGTNGHRLSFTNQQAEARLNQGEISILIAREVLPELLSMISEASSAESIAFHEFDNFGSFKFGRNTLVFRKLDATFPNFQKFVDIQNPIRALVETKALKRALEVVTVLATDRSSRVAMTFGNSQLALQWETETSRGSGNLEIVYEGEPITIGFNGNYFNDFVKFTDAETISIQMRDPNSAALLKPANEPDRHVYVVMPMRV